MNMWREISIGSDAGLAFQFCNRCSMCLQETWEESGGRWGIPMSTLQFRVFSQPYGGAKLDYRPTTDARPYLQCQVTSVLRVTSCPSIMCACHRLLWCPNISFVLSQWNVKQNQSFSLGCYSSLRLELEENHTWFDAHSIAGLPDVEQDEDSHKRSSSPSIDAKKDLWSSGVRAKIASEKLPIMSRIVLRPLRHLQLNIGFLYKFRCTLPLGYSIVHE